MSGWEPLFAELFRLVEGLIIFYVAAINVVYLGLMVLGFWALRSDSERRLSAHERAALLKSPLVPAVSIIAPAYNEEPTIRESVRAMLALEHPYHTVIVVNDGSLDGTLDVLIREFNLYRSSRALDDGIATRRIRGVYESLDPIPLVVVDKDNGGKADALNAGLLCARTPIVAAVDADSVLEGDALLAAMKPFLLHDETLATGGIVRIVNGCRVEHNSVVEVRAPRTLLPLFQSIEYLRAFLGGRVAFSFLNSVLLISGAFGLFRRDAVLEVGGYRTTTVGEDMELVVRLHDVWRRKGEPYRVEFVAEPVCWTEVPTSLEQLRDQRNRWQRGTVESLRAHRHMFMNPRLGTLGLFGFPYFTLFEMLGPSVELLGYLVTAAGLALGWVAPGIALLFFAVAVLFGVLLSLGALVLEQLTLQRYEGPADVARLFGAAVLENLGFRQLMSVWRTRGLIDGLRGKQGWGRMERRGFQVASTD